MDKDHELPTLPEIISMEQILESYKKPQTHYEPDCAAGNFAAPRLVCEAVVRLYPKDGPVPQDQLRIMDIAAGSGLSGQKLYDAGFHNLDALDPATDMMKAALKRGIYTKYYQDTIGYHQTELASNTSDAVVNSAGFAPGHCPPKALDEMIRICKPGGYVVNTMRLEYLVTMPEYHGLERHMDDLESKGLWRRVDRYVTDRYFYFIKQGVTYIYQKL